jgi:4-hydroxy-tetrahydrodipicolinate synthase
MIFKGLYTALITPFNKEGGVDLEVLKTLLNNQIKYGADGVVPLGTTGEAPTLDKEEKINIIKTTVEVIDKKIPVIIGCGSYCTKTAIDNVKMAQDLGADAALIVTPYYNKPTQEGIFKHFEAVDKITNIPLIVYNIAGRSCVNIETSTLKKLAELKNVKGVKEASGNIFQMMDVLDYTMKFKPDFSVLSGDDALTLPLISIGGHGVISVASNIFVTQMRDLVKNALSGNFTVSRKLHFELLPFFKAAFIETNPIPIKEAMDLIGMKAGPTRLPLCEMQSHNKIILKKCLQEMGIV